MARVRDQETYSATRDRLLRAGIDLFRSRSFDGVGINDILKQAMTPKGSFYHYFNNKDDFGLAVSDAYHADQMAMARRILQSGTGTPFEKLKAFFEAALEDFRQREFGDGCLMCNLTSELADQKAEFQKRLCAQWDELTGLIASTIDRSCLESVGLEHLTRKEAADHLVNGWSGALTRMKAERSVEPLTLFLKTYFERGN